MSCIERSILFRLAVLLIVLSTEPLVLLSTATISSGAFQFHAELALGDWHYWVSAKDLKTLEEPSADLGTTLMLVAFVGW